MRKAVQKKFFYFVILLCIIIFQNVYANGPKIVKVALSEESPPTSYVIHGEASGLFKDILALLFNNLPEYKPIFTALPWTRAQSQVQDDQFDLFLTFPSESRKVYADFISEPSYTWNYGYLIYNLKNHNRKQIESAKSFEDLKGLIFLSQDGVEWEKENVPSFIKRVFVNKITTMIHFLFRRNAGDFIIMSPEQALYYATKFGYQTQLGVKKVSFIPNSQVEFHIGVRKKYEGKDELLAALKKIMQNPEFIKKKNKLVAQYKHELPTK